MQHYAGPRAPLTYTPYYAIKHQVPGEQARFYSVDESDNVELGGAFINNFVGLVDRE